MQKHYQIIIILMFKVSVTLAQELVDSNSLRPSSEAKTDWRLFVIWSVHTEII